MVIRKVEDDAGGRHQELAGVDGEKPVPCFPARRESKFFLHNFSFPTAGWGSQRLLRCINAVAGRVVPDDRKETGGGNRAPPSPENPQKSSSPAAREKASEQEEASVAAASAGAPAARPWNLRKRRAACFDPAGESRNRYSILSSSQVLLEKDDPCGAGHLGLEAGEKGQRMKFSVSLSRKEIEEDFYAFKGRRPPLRPQKRARIVQRQIDALLPGLWLSEVTLDSYKVNE
ncbi:hypothetical protein AXF42_Ash005432 [Apostasia shenzhenica]|uniref:DUF1639 domain-containing protein n=1 Tax=Apostasia shenzhenica TaxID=1088818 RepID=A0A2I0B6V9_9ASPA|nr:hypothetical protein AXF42_Ash005432 [Apostasia shenzhenica]